MKKYIKPLLLFLLCFLVITVWGKNSGIQQAQSVKGTVTDANTGESLIGVTVSIKGTSTGVVTGIDGEFSIDIPDSSSILVFSYVGYVSVEMIAGNQTVFDIKLVSDFVNLDEVLVIGYGTQKKSDITGAISSINTKDFEALPVSNVTTAMQGRAAGVQILQNSGSPGSSMTVKIRGTGTINNSTPLYVVDGFVMDNIDYLNPDDIQDIQILKDASSAAIYGARAANGVVVVTTKKGTAGKVNISLNTFWGVSEFWNVPDMMDKYEYKAFYDSTQGGAHLINSLVDSLRFEEYAVDNWLDEVSRKGFIQKYSLQVTGGDDKTKYFFSGSLYDEKGIMNKSSLAKQTVRMNVDSKISKHFTLRGSIDISSSNRSKINEDDDNVFLSTISTTPDKMLYPEGNLILSADSSTVDLVSEALEWNPYTRVWYRDMNDKIYQHMGSIELETKLATSLINVTRAGIDIQTLKGTEFLKRYNPSSTEYFNDINYDDNAFTKSFSTNHKWQFQSIFTFVKKIGENNFDAVTAIDLEGYAYEYLSGRKAMAPGYGTEFQSLSATYLSPRTNDDNTKWRSIGIPLRLNYNYSNKYYLQANFRADATSIFTKENHWGYFPSVSGGWTISNEPFTKNIDWLTILKLRANWGLSGNNRIDELASRNIVLTDNYMTAVSGRNPINHAGWAAYGPGNPNILWEKTSATNFGVDFGFFKSSLTASVDIYDRRTSDMLLQLPQPEYFGTDEAPWQNAGEVSNKGIEAILGFKRVLGKFSFDISCNYTKTYNEVTKLGADGNPVWGGYFDANAAFLKNTYVTYTAVGQPIGMFYGYKIDRTEYENGLWRQEDVDEKFAGKAIPPVNPDDIDAGDVIFMDLNKDNKIDEKDKTFIGNPHPDFMYGFNLKFTYAGLDLVIFFQGVYGNDILNLQRYYMYGYYSQDNNVISGLLEQTYTPNNVDAPYPSVDKTRGANDNYRISDFYIEDGSYLRLKNLQIGYTIPENISKILKMENLRIYFSCYNLITLTNYSGFDPEIGTLNNLYMGVDLGSYPQARTFTGGLTLNF